MRAAEKFAGGGCELWRGRDYAALRSACRARALAERLGITVPDSVTAIDEASLDIDV